MPARFPLNLHGVTLRTAPAIASPPSMDCLENSLFKELVGPCAMTAPHRVVHHLLRPEELDPPLLPVGLTGFVSLAGVVLLCVLRWDVI